MKETLQVLNQMVADGVIDGYVIGGAIAATYYLEPIDTDDLDVFFKDYARILRFLEAEAVNIAALETVLAKHSLSERWQEFLRRFDIKLQKE